jgi:hypothetical protein
LPQVGTPEKFVKRDLYSTIRLGDDLVAGNKRDIETGLQPGFGVANHFPKDPAYSIAHDGVSQPPTCDETIPVVRKQVGSHRYCYKWMVPRPPLAAYPLKIRTAPEATFALHESG